MNKIHKIIKVEDNSGVIIGDVGPYDNEMCIINDDHLRDNTRPIYHLYAISDEKLSIGNMCINLNDNTIDIVRMHGEYTKKHKPIIGTTNKTIKTIPKFSDEFLNKYCQKGGIDEILVDCEYDNIGINENSSYYNTMTKPTIDSNNNLIIYDVQYIFTREEVKKLLNDCWDASDEYKSYLDKINSGWSINTTFYMNKQTWLNKHNII